MSDYKVVCDSCGWRGKWSELLDAPNPFDPENDRIYACPECRQIDTARVVCDEPGCWNKQTCGFPTDSGYRMTCSKHYQGGAPGRDREPVPVCEVVK